MTRIADLELLVRAAELGSLTAAARALDWSPAAASAAVKRMEAQWGVPLFVRSTRSLRPSAEGERLLPHVRQALQALQQARDAAQAQHQALQGELQLALPSDLGRHVLLPWLEEFQQRHPQLALRLHLADRNSDLLRTPIDLAIRYGAPDAATQVALPLAPDNRRVLVASPGYLAQLGSPATPEDLGTREALRFMLGGEVPAAWPLQVDGQWRQVAVQGRRSANDGEVVKRWALAGLGIAYKSWLDVAAELAAGRLVHVNPHWLGEPSPLALVVPARRQLTPAVRSLRDWLHARFAAMAKGELSA
ncbi:LysR family transcriptional regulator [Pseudorhodoferax sp. Leaf265]|jgi:DNA-binding transcriptional LysR family regulator|uniref:LysR family transcriptional regulator n=1 Tax=Pseudorhodoferax sp. Leaf265 TaxID=1736315 RepID=UPI0006F25ED2|nr:LysR family transcriptional regulator [Pseudorhodoferax sp. Leaf265]KQP06332.1 LysR family transcriptional regulator [Pseudorhodoferax sp. Leaf265]